jgi:hypothetical protein
LACRQISLPVAASSATIAFCAPCRYITLSTISGLKMTVPVTGCVHATSSCETLVLLIWVSAVNCAECAPPPYAVQVVYGLAPRVPLVCRDVFEPDCPTSGMTAAAAARTVKARNPPNLRIEMTFLMGAEGPGRTATRRILP